jgi:hypothetical protein
MTSKHGLAGRREPDHKVEYRTSSNEKPNSEIEHRSQMTSVLDTKWRFYKGAQRSRTSAQWSGVQINWDSLKLRLLSVAQPKIIKRDRLQDMLGTDMSTTIPSGLTFCPAKIVPTWNHSQ